jgi:hypothetical protein
LSSKNDNQIVLHGLRNTQTLLETDPSISANKYGWKLVKSYPLTSWKEVIEAAQKLRPDGF